MVSNDIARRSLKKFAKNVLGKGFLPSELDEAVDAVLAARKELETAFHLVVGEKASKNSKRRVDNTIE